ncbi:MAG: hypothetical protein JSS36_10135 [Proteobacteria bacterium]|nr:hypothetical protein [Pseudomonadota bacterium]
MHSTVRALVVALGAGLVLLGGVLHWQQPGSGIGPALIGLLILGSALLEGRYRGRAASPGPGWEPTAELFRDDERGGWVRVWFNPATGERQYRPADPPQP